MAVPDLAGARSIAPVASVWCRQVDNEAESPGYTAIPDEFPGRRETLEAIRLVGNLTVNAADTHDYWDPDPSSTLSYYPNLFVYPAASGRYTCVGRMFLSTEDRPRLGMKTLVFSTSELIESGAFGEMVLRALASLDGRGEMPRPELAAEPSVFQAVGEGLLFHRGRTEPVVVVASDQWDAVGRTVAEMIRLLPASLVALGAFLVFPYFLPAAKVDLHQFTEEIPLALAVMRVPRQEAEGDRHRKRMESWEELPVSLRDLTHPGSARAKEGLPLVLQYVRDEDSARVHEVAQRVDQVEGPRLGAHLSDPDHQRGRDRRREMWRIGTAMETAALLLSRPKGRAVKVSAEAQKRASQYLDARPGEAPQLTGRVDAPAVGPAPGTSSPAPAYATRLAAPGGAAAGPSGSAGVVRGPSPPVPQWLRPSAGITLPPEEPNRVPISTSEDPSQRRAPLAPGPGPGILAPARTPMRSFDPRVPTTSTPRPPSQEGPIAWLPSPNDLDSRIARAVQQAEGRIAATIEGRLKGVTDSLDGGLREPLAALTRRLEALEQRPVPTAEALGAPVEARLRASTEARFSEADRRLDERVLQPLVALARRTEALENRPTPPTAEAVGSEVETRLLASLEPRLSDSEARLAAAAREISESWADRLRRELKEAVDEFAARASRSEEELRTSLAAQIDLEVLEAKEQGTVLREELEGRMRELLERHQLEAERRRGQEAGELEQRVAVLVEGRAHELEKRLATTLADRTERLTAITDDRISHVERRLSAERDARLGELTEAHRAALAALHARMQATVDQKLHETRAEDERRDVALAERLHGEVDTAIDRHLASPAFVTGLETHVRSAVDALRADQTSGIARVLEDAERRIASAREEGIARLTQVQQQLEARQSDLAGFEDALRAELDDLDRRLMVVNDHVLPLVRQTWLKVSEQEFAARAKVTESRLTTVRQELAEEIRRVEGELLQQQSDLRDRMEASVASHGRIWLNLLRQFSPEGGGGGMPPAAMPPSHRFPRRARAGGPALPSPAENAAMAADTHPFASDPPNPMDPELGQEFGSKDGRRRPRRP